MPINFRLYKHVYASVAAGIRCDVRNNDVLPPYMSFIQFTSPQTTLFRYNIEPKTLTHIPPIIVLFKIFPSIFPIFGDKNIVQYLYCDFCHNRPLPTPGLFPIFSFFHQKNTTRISCGVVVPSPANFIVITMDLARAA